MTYPDDANGDVLRRMEEAGDDLSRPRDIEFTVVFPSETSAEGFAKEFQHLGYAASVEFTETVDGLPWDVVVVKHMVPTHKQVGEFEDLLQSVATPLGGSNDGWGCFAESDE